MGLSAANEVAEGLVADCAKLGVTLTVRGGKLFAKPTGVLPERLRGLVKLHRSKLIDLLEARAAEEIIAEPKGKAPATTPEQFAAIAKAVESDEPYPNAREGSAVINKLLGAGFNPQAERQKALLEQGLGNFGRGSPLGLPLGRGPVRTG